MNFLMKVSLTVVFAFGVVSFAYGAQKPKKKAAEPSALDKYIAEAMSHEQTVPVQPSAGSLWSPASRLTDLGGDLRAVQTNDLVTIVVNEQASAVVTGATQTSRKSTTNNSISSLAGPKSATGLFNNLAATSGDTELNGSGTTSRGTT